MKNVKEYIEKIGISSELFLMRVERERPLEGVSPENDLTHFRGRAIKLFSRLGNISRFFFHQQDS